MDVSEWQANMMANLFYYSYSLERDLTRMSPEDGAHLVRQVIDENDLVFGMWPDETISEGFGWLIVKGAPYLQRILEARDDGLAKVAAIPCANRDHAIMAREDFGDDAVAAIKLH